MYVRVYVGKSNVRTCVRECAWSEACWASREKKQRSARSTVCSAAQRSARTREQHVGVQDEHSAAHVDGRTRHAVGPDVDALDQHVDGVARRQRDVVPRVRRVHKQLRALCVSGGVCVLVLVFVCGWWWS